LRTALSAILDLMRHGVREAAPADIPDMARVYLRSWRGAYEPFLEMDDLEELAAQRARDFDWSRGMKAPDAEGPPHY
jgi:hypothetical protein